MDTDWTAHVEHTPDPSYPRLLASIRFTRREPSAEAADGLTQLLARQTDRRRFAAWPVPEAQLESLARYGSQWGVTVTSVADEAVRLRLLRLTAEADQRQRRDPAYATELATWTRDRERDGIPAGNVPEADPGLAAEALVPQRFPAGPSSTRGRTRQPAPGHPRHRDLLRLPALPGACRGGTQRRVARRHRERAGRSAAEPGDRGRRNPTAARAK